MKNFIQHGSSLSFIATAVVLSGQALLVGSTFGVAINSAAVGEEFELKRVGVFELPKAAGQAWTAGESLYWDAAAKNLTTTANGNRLVGAAAASVAAAGTSGAALLDGVIR